MIIHPLGRHVGTVGGGCGEADVMRAALDVLQTGEPATVRVDLTEDVSMQALGVCGGILDVFVERVGSETDEGRKTKDGSTFVVGRSSFVTALLASIRAREPVALATVVSGPSAGREAVVWLDKPPLGDLGLGDLAPQVIADAQEVLRGRQHKLLKYEFPSALDAQRSTLHVFVEVQRRSPELLIVGGGHIAVPLAQMASLCDFAVTVLDDRPSFANKERFPNAAKSSPRRCARPCAASRWITTPSSSSSPAATATTSTVCWRCSTGPWPTSA